MKEEKSSEAVNLWYGDAVEAKVEIDKDGKIVMDLSGLSEEEQMQIRSMVTASGGVTPGPKCWILNAKCQPLLRDYKIIRRLDSTVDEG
jgi:predicted GTPase